MLGSSTIQQYFASGKSHYISPQVSFEWNYNLFYAPYLTTNGSPTKISISDSWSSTNNTITTVPSGRSTTVFLNDTGQTTRSCISINTTNNSSFAGFGDASITLGEISSTTNAYKVTFFAKVDRDAQVNLSALAYIDSHRAHSSSQIIDSIQWTKFEIYLSSQPLGTAAYSSPTISLHHNSLDGATTYGVLIDQLEVHLTSDFEYKYGNLWSTAAPFNAFRPGESFVPSGNSLCQLPSNFRKINTDLSISTGSQVSNYKWNSQTMPVSPVVYHPTLLGTNAPNFNPIYKNGSLSEWSQYKYFVADSSIPTISAVYDQLLNVNKIVIKFNTVYSVPSSFTVTLGGFTNTASGSNTTVYSYSTTLINSDIDSSGTCILYYNSAGGWLTGTNPSGPWTGTADTTSVPGTPSFDYQGNIKFGGAKGGTVNATVQINSIQVTQNSSTVNSAYSSYTSVDENLTGTGSKVDKTSEFQRMQIVEISPRLEVDVSYYTMSVQTDAELDNQQNPLPISQISSNMATVTLSSIPLNVSNTIVSLFSNNSTNSVLKGLFKNYVKCYVGYRILDSVTGSSSSDKVIPGGVFYVDTWDISDVEKTVVTAYDITKYLQLVQPTDYVSQSEDGFRLISNILDFAGFTDYDYDSLKKVTSSKHTDTSGIQTTSQTPIRIRYFYVDGSQQKVFDVLREILEAYQIAAYVDSYGVLKFINIDGIFDPSNPINMQLHDTTGGVSVTGISGTNINDGYANSLTIDPNIVIDTFTETTKTKVGKATLTYKTPQIEKTISSDPRLANSSNLYVDFAPTFMDSTNAIWDSTIDDAATYNTLASTMKQSDTYFTVPSYEATAASTQNINFRSYSIDHDGYGIIENEIVSFQYKEWAFTGTGADKSIYNRSILNSADFAAQQAEINNLFGNNPYNHAATGRITNVKRGQFNTPVSDHIVMASLADIQTKFNTGSLTPSIINGNIAITQKVGAFAYLSANDPGVSSSVYNTFSTKIVAGINSNTSNPSGTAYGLVMFDSTQSTSLTVFIQENIVNGVRQYHLGVGVNGKSFLSVPYINVTKIINDQIKYPKASPFEDYAKYINLKFVKGSGNPNNAFEVFINKTQVPLSTLSGLTASSIDTSGGFGMYVGGLNTVPVTIQFGELYATQTALLDEGALYHYHLPWFAEKLASNKKIFEISWMAQSTPAVSGINYYDIKDTQAPSFDVYPLKIPYKWYYYTNGAAPTSGIPLPSIDVDENSLAYSPIYHSGFKSRFAIVNASPSMVWLRKSPDTINKINVDFSLITDSLITLGNDVVIERVFDVANINETVDITSSWIQDKDTAISVLRTISRALESFSRNITVSVYGNPLFEIGDIVVVNYKLKNIVNQKYVVQGIQQSFDTGLSTILTLNNIGDAKVVLPNKYSASGALGGSVLPGGSTGGVSGPTGVSTGGTGGTIPSPTPAPVFSVTGTTGATAGAFSFAWSNPPVGTISYNVTVNGPGSGSLSPSYGLTGVPLTTTSESYTGGIPGALYNISVTAIGSLGILGTATGYANAFGATSAFTATGTTGSTPGSFTISWANAPSNTYQYAINVTPRTTGILPSTFQYVNLSTSSQTFTNATPSGSYSVNVTPYDINQIPTVPGGFVVNNVIAGASSTIPLPGIPTITYSSPTSNTVSAGFTVTWASSNATNYSVNIYNGNNGNSVSGYPTTTSNTSATLTGLVPNTQYDVSVQGINLTGSGQVFTNYTTTQAASSPSSSFTVVGSKVYSIGLLNFTWSNPPTGTVSYSVQLLGPLGDSVPYTTTATLALYMYLIPGASYTMNINALNSSSATIGTATTTITA